MAVQDTSGEAYDDLNHSQELQRQAELTYAIASQHPDRTAIEMLTSPENAGRLHEWQLRSRLTFLLTTGCVEQRPKRICEVRGRRMITWRVISPFSTVVIDTRPTPRQLLTGLMAGIFEVGRGLPKGDPIRVELSRLYGAIRRGELP